MRFPNCPQVCDLRGSLACPVCWRMPSHPNQVGLSWGPDLCNLCSLTQLPRSWGKKHEFWSRLPGLCVRSGGAWARWLPICSEAQACGVPARTDGLVQGASRGQRDGASGMFDVWSLCVKENPWLASCGGSSSLSGCPVLE